MSELDIHIGSEEGNLLKKQPDWIPEDLIPYWQKTAAGKIPDIFVGDSVMPYRRPNEAPYTGYRSSDGMDYFGYRTEGFIRPAVTVVRTRFSEPSGQDPVNDVLGWPDDRPYGTLWLDMLTYAATLQGGSLSRVRMIRERFFYEPGKNQLFTAEADCRTGRIEYTFPICLDGTPRRLTMIRDDGRKTLFQGSELHSRLLCSSSENLEAGEYTALAVDRHTTGWLVAKTDHIFQEAFQFPLGPWQSAGNWFLSVREPLSYRMRTPADTAWVADPRHPDGRNQAPDDRDLLYLRRREDWIRTPPNRR